MSNKTQQLQQLKSLLDSGILSQEEFEKQKQDILKSETNKTKSSNRSLSISLIVILLIAVVSVIMYIFSSNSSSPTSVKDTKERVANIGLSFGYDKVLEIIKQDKDNLRRGVMLDEDQKVISTVQKDYRGVRFDYIDYNFKDGLITSIELRKTSNSDEDDPEESIMNCYAQIIKSLKSDYPSYSDDNGSMTFSGQNEHIKVNCENSYQDEYELIISIELE